MAKRKKGPSKPRSGRSLNEHFRNQASAHGLSDGLISRFEFLEPPGGLPENFKEKFAAGVIRQIYEVAAVPVPTVEDEPNND